MTNQEFFNKVWERAKDPRESMLNDKCMYRGPNGLRCFVGECIPDEEYDPAIEGSTVQDLHLNNTIPPALKDVDVDLMVECQTVHDGYMPEFWRKELTLIAKKHKLQIQDR